MRSQCIYIINNITQDHGGDSFKTLWNESKINYIVKLIKLWE
jgi:hypothetical protein